MLALQEARFQKRCGVRRCELLLSCTKSSVGSGSETEVVGDVQSIQGYNKLQTDVQSGSAMFGSVWGCSQKMLRDVQRFSKMFRIVPN